MLGAAGCLGGALQRALAARGWSVTGADRATVDVTEPGAVRRVLRDVRPEVVYNAAAYTAVDQAEREPARAAAINAVAPGLLSRAAREAGARFVHFSTDYVFDGAAVRPYTESDPANPLSVYGRTKLEGEQAVLAEPSALVIRTAWLYGSGGRNFPSRLADLLREGQAVRALSDAHGSPTWGGAVAERSVDLVERDATGLFHTACTGYTTWQVFATRLAVTLGVDPALVQPVTGDELARPAPRPRFSALASERLASLGLTMPSWEAAQDSYLA